MRKVRWGIGLAVVALAIAAPAMAEATTYCVHQGGTCPAGQADEGADLQKALDDASAASGNTVLVGPGTFTHANGFHYLPGLPLPTVTVTGAGAGHTILESTGANPGFVLSIDASASSVLSGVTIHLRHQDGGGLSISTSTASGIAIATDAGGPGNQRPLAADAGATVQHSTIAADAAPAGCCEAAVFANSGDQSTLFDDTLLGGYEGIDAEGAGTSVIGRDLRIVGTNGVEAGASASATIDDLLATLNPASLGFGVRVDPGGTLVVRSATIAGRGVAGSTGLKVDGGGSVSNLTVNDSIVSGYPTAYDSEGNGGTANLTIDNDDILGHGTVNSTGTFEHTEDIDVDPQWVNASAGDYRLRFGSPVIDAGNACNSICQTVPDLDGVTRPVDGDADGIAIRDMGAYEYGHRAPTVSAAAGASTATTGQAVVFTAAASDPDAGDAIALSWRFDDGSTATGASVSHAFATAGAHTASVTATDPSGLTAAAAATVSVVTPPAQPDRTAPSVGSVHLSHRTFRRGRHSARAAKRSPTGTKVSFSLSENATVKLTFAKRDRRHHYKTVHNRSVTLTLKAGKPKIAFDGIVDHHHRLSTGAYELKLVATDAAGNRSKTRTAKFTIASH